MKRSLFKALGLFILGAVVLASCTDDSAKMTLSSSPKANTLSTFSSNTFVLVKEDAGKTFQKFTWTKPDFGFPAGATYTLMMDSSATFANPLVLATVSPGLSDTITVGDLNLKLINAAYKTGKAYQMNFRVMSVVATNVAPVYSNTVTVSITAYSTIPPPKYAVPDSLYLVGGATPGGWSNPVVTPSQKFTKIDADTYGLVTTLTAGGDGYDLLPLNGSWSNKYNVPAKAAAAGLLTFDFQPSTGPGDDIPPPSATGLYKIIVDFHSGQITLTALTSNPVPANLYIVGNATDGGWANPVPTPSQQFKQISNGEFRLTVNITAGGDPTDSNKPRTYLWLPLNGNWDHKFGGTDPLAGTVLADGAVPGSNTPTPATSGMYVIDVNFLSGLYTVKPK